MADVFISYASEDRERARPLAAALEARGLSVWWDRALAGGEDYANAIRRALDDAKAVVVLWSRASVSSPWVRDEAARARAGKRLAPVLLDPVDIPPAFAAVQTADFTAWRGDENAPELMQLHAALAARLAGEAGGGKHWLARIAGWRVYLAIIAAGLALLAAGTLQVRRLSAPPAYATMGEGPEQLMAQVSRVSLPGEAAAEVAHALRAQVVAAAAPATLAEAAGDTFEDAAAALLQTPDAGARAAIVQAAYPQTRDAGLETLWAQAQRNGPSAAALYRAFGAVAVAAGAPDARAALERARDANPQDRRVWRMLAFAYARGGEDEAARGARLVADGLEAGAAGDADAAAAALQRALAVLKRPQARAFVLGQLGDDAAKRDDWDAAEARYRQAVAVRGEIKDFGGLAIDAAKLARAQVQQGEAEAACASLRQAAARGAETAPGQVAEACGPR